LNLNYRVNLSHSFSTKDQKIASNLDPS